MKDIKNISSGTEPVNRKALIIRAFLIFLVIFLSIGFIRIFIIEFYFIPSVSMTNTLLPGDFVVASRLSYFFGFPARLPLFNFESPIKIKLWYSKIKRGDVVIFGYPEHGVKGGTHNLIKRIIGLPGDTLIIKGNIAYVNGVMQELPPESATRFQPLNNLYAANEPPDTVIVPKKGMTLRLNANNYRQWKSAIENEGSYAYSRDNQVFINDKPDSVFIPKEDYYYVMGDNRSLSSDSRQWGFLPENNIIGRALFIFLSIGDDGSGNHLRFNRIGKTVR